MCGPYRFNLKRLAKLRVGRLDAIWWGWRWRWPVVYRYGRTLHAYTALDLGPIEFRWWKPIPWKRIGDTRT